MKADIAGVNIDFRDIEISDAEFVLSLRVDSKKSSFLNKVDNNLQKQIDYINNYKLKEDEYYFIIESKDKLNLGTVRIYDIKREIDSFSWGSWLLKNGIDLTIALESATMVYDFGFYHLGFKNCHIEVRKGNHRVISFHKLFGVKEIAEDELYYYYTYTVADYEKIRPKLKIF